MGRYRLLAYRESHMESFPLDDGREQWVIGRSSECDIRLADPTVSRQHVVLSRRGEEFQFEDRGANPVLLNGVRTPRGTLVPGTPLLVGSSMLYLDLAARDAAVRLEEPTTDTVHGMRRYPEGEILLQPLSAGRSPEARHAVDLAAALLAPERDPDASGGLAEQLVDASMRWLGFGRGVLALLPAGREVAIVTSRSRDDSPVVALPRALVEELRVRGRPFLQPISSGEGRDAYLVIPLGQPLQGALVFGRPAPDVALDDSLLRAGAVLGAAVWTRWRESEERRALRQQLERVAVRETPTSSAIAASARLTAACAEIDAAASHALPVFLLGEDGTEKEELARRLHARSDRAAQPFVTFYASVVAPERIEEELFGAAQALSVARSGRVLLRAQGGTLFLDQPEQLPAHVQDRLAQVFAERSIAVGEGRHIPIDIRLVAASTEDPALAQGDAGLRPALAELLHAIRIVVPPLRACPEDAVALALHFLAQMPAAPDGLPRTLSERTAQVLQACPWPGNARQLKRALEVAAARAGNRPIEARDFPEDVRQPEPMRNALPTLAEVERAHIVRVLAAAGGVKRRAAELLGIAVSTLHDKMRRYDVR